jgi:uncharacterized protein
MGLRFRQELGQDEGMLFVFPAVRPVSFWMKDCVLPLSVGLIDPNGSVLEILDLAPNDANWVRSKSENVRFALEVRQGWFQRRGLAPGVQVRTEQGPLCERFPGGL